MEPRKPRTEPAPKPKRTTREVFTAREFGRYLRTLGATKGEVDRVTFRLSPGVMAALLPAWRRMRVAWRARHG